MSSAAIERRVAPRFAVRCSGELAAGNAVTGVMISDVSVTGCGIELTEPADGVVGLTGVLSIPSASPGGAALMLPVLVSNGRVEGDRARLGLQFRRLTMAQMRGLIGVMDGNIGR